MNLFLKRSSFMFGTLFLTISLIIYPNEALNASIRGLDIWWEIVFPSLLPFFIMAELLISFGAITFIGILFEPIMRPIFNIPGAGSLALIMGMASGYPTGAKITARLREENKLTRNEAERLVSFTNASSPLFIFGAIAIGFFKDAKVGLLLAICHYGGNLIVGIIMRFLHTKQGEQKKPLSKQTDHPLQQAFKQMHQENINRNRPLGEIMGDAVYNSIKTLIIVGGFITFFSVITEILLHTNLLMGFAYFIKLLFSWISFPINLSIPLVIGLFELSIGVQHIAQLPLHSFLYQMIVISFILGFNGLSVQAQVSSIISKTDIRFKPYFYARLLHGIIASILTYFVYHVLYNPQGALPVNFPININLDSMEFISSIYNQLAQVGPILTIISLGFACFYHMYVSRNSK